MEYSNKEIKVGLMLVIGFSLIVLFLVAIFGVSWTDNTKEYTTYLKSIPGIATGSLVKFGGMDVGFVSEIALPPSNDVEAKICIKLKVDDRTPVRENSLAYVTTIGIMTNQHIEISAGTADSPLLLPGSVLKSKEVLSFMQMAEPFGELSDHMRILIERLSDVFNDENRQHLSEMLTNMNTIVNSSGNHLSSLVANLDKLTANLTEVSNSLNDLMNNNKDGFDETLDHLQATTKETSMLVSDLRKTLGQFESLISANGASVIEIMENFQYASQNLEEFTRAVKERPWLLVRKSAPADRKIP